jgi:hypothetical protein
MLLLALCAAGAVRAAEPPNLVLKDATTVVSTLKDMGHAADVLPDDKGKPSTNIRLQTKSGPVLLVLGGCSATEACSYLVIVSIYTDIINVNPAFVARLNGILDLAKVVTNDAGQVQINWGVYTGRAGIPRSMLQEILSQFSEVESFVIAEARKEGYIE